MNATSSMSNERLRLTDFLICCDFVFWLFVVILASTNGRRFLRTLGQLPEMLTSRFGNGKERGGFERWGAGMRRYKPLAYGAITSELHLLTSVSKCDGLSVC